MSRPRAASRRSPDAVIELSGNAIFAATESRKGADPDNSRTFGFKVCKAGPNFDLGLVPSSQNLSRIEARGKGIAKATNLCGKEFPRRAVLRALGVPKRNESKLWRAKWYFLQDRASASICIKSKLKIGQYICSPFPIRRLFLLRYLFLERQCSHRSDARKNL